MPQQYTNPLSPYSKNKESLNLKGWSIFNNFVLVKVRSATGPCNKQFLFYMQKLILEMITEIALFLCSTDTVLSLSLLSYSRNINNVLILIFCQIQFQLPFYNFTRMILWNNINAIIKGRKPWNMKKNKLKGSKCKNLITILMIKCKPCLKTITNFDVTEKAMSPLICTAKILSLTLMKIQF